MARLFASPFLYAPPAAEAALVALGATCIDGTFASGAVILAICWRDLP